MVGDGSACARTMLKIESTISQQEAILERVGRCRTSRSKTKMKRRLKDAKRVIVRRRGSPAGVIFDFPVVWSPLFSSGAGSRAAAGIWGQGENEIVPGQDRPRERPGNILFSTGVVWGHLMDPASHGDLPRNSVYPTGHRFVYFQPCVKRVGWKAIFIFSSY
jgi:hypothetical protein